MSESRVHEVEPDQDNNAGLQRIQWSSWERLGKFAGACEVESSGRGNPDDAEETVRSYRLFQDFPCRGSQ
jgi:hypothetical protein